jgi:hypothetical protein
LPAAGLITHFAIRTPVSPYRLPFWSCGDSCVDNDEEKPDEPLVIDVGIGALILAGALVLLSYAYSRTTDFDG